MPNNPEDKPREFLIIAVATGLKIFGNKPWSNEDYFREAEAFVKVAEDKYGKINLASVAKRSAQK